MSAKLTVLNVVEMLLKRWWILLLALIVGASAFFSYFSFAVEPTYASTGSLFVNNMREKKSENVSIGDMTTSQMLVWTYMELLKSNTFMDQVAKTADLGYSGGQISGMISMNPKNDTEIMQITASTHNPAHSQKLVNTILECAPMEIDRIIEGGSVKIVDYAYLPTKPVGPNVLLYTLVGGAFGFAVAAGIVVLREILDNRVKDEDDLLKLYNVPVLGMIPDIR